MAEKITVNFDANLDGGNGLWLPVSVTFEFDPAHSKSTLISVVAGASDITKELTSEQLAEVVERCHDESKGFPQ